MSIFLSSKFKPLNTQSMSKTDENYLMYITVTISVTTAPVKLPLIFYKNNLYYNIIVIKE